MRQNTYRPRRSRLRAAANILLMLSTVIAFGGGVVALLSLAGCDATWSLRASAPTAVVVVDRMQASQPDEVHAQSQSITPITSLSASRPTELGGSTTGSLYASADFIDIIAKSGSTATLNLVYYDTTAAAWAVYGTSCAVTTDLAACRYNGKRGQFYWHIYKSTGSVSTCLIEQVYRGSSALGSIEPAQATGLSNVAVSSPLSGDGTSGSPVTLGTVPVTKGGTGLTSISTGDLPYGSASNVLSALAAGASGRALVSGGAGTAPAWTAAGGDVSGSYGSMTVTKLRGNAVSANAPTGTQVLQWDSIGNEWVPTTRGNVPISGLAGQVLYHDGSAWVALAAGTSGQVLQSSGAGAPSWVWPVNYRLMFTNAVAGSTAFGQGVTSNAQGREIRPVRVIGAGTLNFVVLTALNTTSGGSITVQLFKSTDGNTWAVVAGQSRTITTAVAGSQSDSSALADLAIADGDWYEMRVVGYTGTIGSLMAILRFSGGAQVAHLHQPANDNAHAERMVA